MHRGLMLEDLAQDLRISLRSLLRVPTLTFTILITVGLGIGATTVIFAAIDAALLRPLPYGSRAAWCGSTPIRRRSCSASPLVDYLALEAQQTQFERIAGFTDRSMAFNNGTSRRSRARPIGVVGLLRHARHLTCTGPGFHRDRRTPGQPSSGHPQPEFLAATLGGRPDVVGTRSSLMPPTTRSSACCHARSGRSSSDRSSSSRRSSRRRRDADRFPTG